MSSLEAHLYGLALDRCHGDEEQAKWEARMALEEMARHGDEQAINELSHKVW